MKFLIKPMLAMSIFLLFAPLEVTAQDFKVGLLAYDRGDYHEAFEEWEPLAQNGDQEAQKRLGNMYDEGLGVAQNKETAANWYREAAEQGHILAQYNLGAMFFHGEGVEQNIHEAIFWFRKSHDQGDSDASFFLALALMSESNGSSNEGRELLQKLAENGSMDAQFMYGALFLEEGARGDALPWLLKAADQGSVDAYEVLGGYFIKSPIEAAKWYLKASEQGNARSQYLLGFIFANGELTKHIGYASTDELPLIESDILGLMWVFLAKENGHVEADQLFVDIQESMTSEDVEVSLKIAQSCKAQNYRGCNSLLQPQENTPTPSYLEREKWVECQRRARASGISGIVYKLFYPDKYGEC